MTNAAFNVAADGPVSVTGPMGFATAGRLLESSSDIFVGRQSIKIDLSGVSTVDSAALALIIEWLRLARENSCVVEFVAVPEKLLAIARLSGVEDIIASSS